MRTVELAKIATAAEALRLRRIVRRQALRGAYLAGAAVFAIAVLIVLHVLVYFALAIWLPPIAAIAIVLMLDLVGAGVLGYLGIGNVPDPIEIEARQIRTQATVELKRSLTVVGMAGEMVGAILRTGARRGMRRGFATAVAETATRLMGR